MTRNGVLAAGNWIIDKIKQLDRWPGEGNLCNIHSEVRSSGGGPANVLFDLATIDPSLPLYAAGMVGRDSEGEFILSEIRRHGVNADHMLVNPKIPTSYTDVMGAEGRRTFFHCRGANAELGVDDLAHINVPAKFFYLGYLLLLDKLDSPDGQGRTQAVRLLEIMKSRGYRTVVDFVSEAPEKFRSVVLPALPAIDILIVNEVEAACCCSLELRGTDGVMRWKALPRALEFMFEHGVGEVAVIHFPEGAVGQSRNGKFVFVPSCDIARSEIVGSTGAGDAFAAGVIYGLHRDWELEQALRLGGASSNFNLRSATACDGAVSLETMLDFLKNCRYTELSGVAFD